MPGRTARRCPKPVILTFDDGYVDNYKNAYPILEKYNLKGTIFLISDFIGTYPNYMTWAQVDEMQQSGLIDFESHTLSHPELDKIPADEVWHQLDSSKKALEWRLGKPINFIAYPCGSYDEELERMTKEAGYRAAFTVHYGLANPDENPTSSTACRSSAATRTSSCASACASNTRRSSRRSTR